MFPVCQMFPTSWSWSPVVTPPAGLDSQFTSWLPVSQTNSAGWLSWSQWWPRGEPHGRRPRLTQWVSLEQARGNWGNWLSVSSMSADSNHKPLWPQSQITVLSVAVVVNWLFNCVGAIHEQPILYSRIHFKAYIGFRLRVLMDNPQFTYMCR